MGDQAWPIAFGLPLWDPRYVTVYLDECVWRIWPFKCVVYLPSRTLITHKTNPEYSGKMTYQLCKCIHLRLRVWVSIIMESIFLHTEGYTFFIHGPFSEILKMIPLLGNDRLCINTVQYQREGTSASSCRRLVITKLFGCCTYTGAIHKVVIMLRGVMSRFA